MIKIVCKKCRFRNSKCGSISQNYAKFIPKESLRDLAIEMWSIDQNICRLTKNELNAAIIFAFKYDYKPESMFFE